MSEIEVPEGVGFASLAVVGRVARVLLRSDGRFHCAFCRLSPTIDDVQVDMETAGGTGAACAHIRDVYRMGVIHLDSGPDLRLYPVFVWKRGGQKTVAHWPSSTDPDGAIAALAEALEATTRGTSTFWALRGGLSTAIAEAAMLQMRRKGYVVVPEWLSRVKPKDASQPTGRGARVIDFGEDEA